MSDNFTLHIERSKSLVVRDTLDVKFFLILALIVNGVFLLAENHGSDMGFWVSWAQTLGTRGYAAFDGNYPPVYVHWLYLCGRLASGGYLELSNNLTYKFFAFAPVIFAHLSLIRLASIICNKYSLNNEKRFFILMLMTVNPAFIMDGPVWGQVDILPTAICAWSLYVATLNKWNVLALPLFMLALLTKFQMICVAPIIGAIFFWRFRIHLIGAALALIVFIAVYSPFILSGNFIQAFRFAYIDTLGQYPVTSLNAANLMLLLTGNESPDGLTLINTDSDMWANVLSVKTIGMLSYAFLSLFIMGQLLRLLSQKKKHLVTQKIFIYAALSSIAFFMLLPGMHERYGVPSVVFAVLASILNPRLLIPSLLISLFSAFNIAMILPLKGELLWRPLALAFCLSSIPFFLAVFCEPRIDRIRLTLVRYLSKLSAPFRFGLPELIVVLALVSVLFSKNLVKKELFVDPMSNLSGVSLVNLPIRSQSQGWGSLTINNAINGAPLTINGKVFYTGFGVHAQSEIVFDLNATYKTIAFMYGIDDFSKGGYVRFVIYGDNKLLWRSQRLSNGEKIKFESVNIENINELKLVVESLGSQNGDHADWINPLLMQ